MSRESDMQLAEERAHRQGDVKGGERLPQMVPEPHNSANPAEEAPAGTPSVHFPVLFGVIGGLALISLAWMIVDYVVR